MPLGRDELLRSLEEQRRRLANSIVLTPVDNLPLSLADRDLTAFLHGIYLSDKQRDRAAAMAAVIQFGGREQAVRDLVAINELLATVFGGAAGSLRLLAGLQAHAATFMSIARAGQTVLLLPAEAGGHYNSHAILQRLGLRTLDLPIDHGRLCVDHAATADLVAAERPDFVFIDRSEGLRYEDFSFVGRMAGPVKVFDASQYVTQIVTGRYDNPLAWGFDLMLFSLHKSFPGPQKAGVVGRATGELWTQLLAGLSTLVSSSHAESSYLVALTFLRADVLETYVERMLSAAAALERCLLEEGVSVCERARQGDARWPATHHLWVTTSGQDEAFAAYERLAAVNVQVNYRKLPYGLGHGLRLGTSFAAAAGVSAHHAPELASIVAGAIAGEPAGGLRRRVRDLAHDAAGDALVRTEHWL